MSGTCSVSSPDEDLGTLEFAWSSAAGGYVAKTLGKSSWSVTAVSAVRVTVTISDPAGAIAEATETETADVAARDWTWPAGEDLGERNDTIPDSCYGNAMGLTVGRMGGGSCSGYFFDYLDGFAVGAGEGPWKGRWYVASADSSDSVAGAYWGLNPEIRSDGPAYNTETLLASIRRQSGCRSSANVYKVNACSSSEKTSNNRSAAFDGLDEEVRKHEAAHVSAVVAEAAKHDVWGD